MHPYYNAQVITIKSILNLSLRKVNDENALSSSIEPSTWTIAISVSLIYLEKEVDRAEFASSCLQSFVKGFKMGMWGLNPGGGSSIAHVQLLTMAIWNSGCFDSNLYLSNIVGMNFFSPSFPTHLGSL
jgi:hypothetical protein